MKRSLRLAWGSARRFLLVHFRKRYVQEQKGRRRGECDRCGKCCDILVPCAFLRNRNHCGVYNVHPRQCQAFPIDERDLRDVPECKHWFQPNGQEEPERARGADADAPRVGQEVLQSSSRKVPQK